MEDLAARCFHGKLDRRTAEERLSVKGKFGSYLLRESDRKAGSFVLSYHGRCGINHFRVVHVYGAYFIGGRQFDSLTDLLHYYSSVSDLLTDERLLHPIPPSEPVAARERLFISILPYSKLAQSDELSFKKGDILILQNDLGDGWLWCRDVKTGESGLVFSDLIEEVREDIDPNVVFPWFHTNISKTDAVNRLAQAGPGSFLVRPSDNSPGNYTLFYHVGTTVQRFLIVRIGQHRYTMGGKCFDSLGQIIDLYQSEQIIEGHILQFPITTTMSRADQLSETTLSSSMHALRVREKPQDVYNTVKLSREAAQKKQNHEIRGWLSLKKGDLQKKWKSYFFVLNSRDRHLYYYEKPQQIKPKGLIDLSYSYIYRVHGSLFEWGQCLQIIEKCLPCFANNIFLRCDEERVDYERWFYGIKRFTSLNQSLRRNIDVRQSKSNNLDENAQTNGDDTFEVKRDLYLNVIEAHSLKVSQPFFVIAFNQIIKVAKTPAKTNPTAAFNEDGYFAFENIPADVNSITIYIHQSGKKSKANVELAQFSIDLKRLAVEGGKLDHWFEFHASHSPDILGRLRLKIFLSRDIIMNLQEYAALEDLICDPSAEIITILDQLCSREHLALARALSNLFRHRRTSARILKILIEREASLVQEPAGLFKTSSLITTLVEFYMRSTCQTALKKCLRAPVRKLLDDKISCELNPSKFESHTVSQKACENLQNLLDLLDELVSNIYSSIECYPIPARYLLSCLQRSVQQKWPTEPLIRTRIVSSFVFLRLICPTILNPKQFNLINKTPSENAIRNLTLVAKCLQNLATLVETSKSSNSLAQSILTTLEDYATYPTNHMQLSCQSDYSTNTNSLIAFILSPQIESWMEVVNPFILKNKVGLIKFIDELCNIDYEADPILIDKPLDSDNNDHDIGDVDPLTEDEVREPVQDLASVHRICEEHREGLEQLSGTSSAARKLVMILTILTQHKQYYSSLKETTQPTDVTSI